MLDEGDLSLVGDVADGRVWFVRERHCKAIRAVADAAVRFESWLKGGDYAIDRLTRELDEAKAALERERTNNVQLINRLGQYSTERDGLRQELDRVEEENSQLRYLSGENHDLRCANKALHDRCEHQTAELARLRKLLASAGKCIGAIQVTVRDYLDEETP